MSVRSERYIGKQVTPCRENQPPDSVIIYESHFAYR